MFVGTAHRNNSFLTSINSFLDGLQKIHSQFQLWISVNWHAPTPRLFRRNAMKIVCDPPQVSEATNYPNTKKIINSERGAVASGMDLNPIFFKKSIESYFLVGAFRRKLRL